MSHQAQWAFVEIVSERLKPHFNDCSVLEVGSLDLNGSVRRFFQNCRYIGIDVGSGAGVDVVCQGQDYDAPDNSFDTVISCEAMEHNPYWKATFLNMCRVCRPGGLVLMTCATTGRPEHGTSRTTPANSPLTVELGWDYYKNLSAQDFLREIDFNSTFSHHLFSVNWGSYDLYFVGIKNDHTAPPVSEWNALTNSIQQFAASQNQRKVCFYRSLLARWLGEFGFDCVRWISARLKLRKRKTNSVESAT